ncbi:MAG: alpha/beta fold hydrolase [Bryobacteraceae bacterium]
MSAGLSAGGLEDLEHLTFQNGDVRLHAVAAGPHEGPVVILLHGFPEFWYGWRKQILALAASGFRVVAPDQRGYNTSSKPADVARYRLRELVSDIAAMIGELGQPRVYLAGHDWGAVVAWAVAAWHKEKVARLAILNVPHPGVMWRFLLTHPSQLRRSWYMFFFQIPRVPELLFSARNFRAGVRSLVRTSRPETFSPEELTHYRSAWAQPGAVTAMIHWYRALFRYPGSFRVGRIEVPTRILWGRKDAFLHPSLATVSRRMCAFAEVVWFDEATHWVHLEETDAINSSLIQFFSEPL